MKPALYAALAVLAIGGVGYFLLKNSVPSNIPAEPRDAQPSNTTSPATLPSAEPSETGATTPVPKTEIPANIASDIETSPETKEEYFSRRERELEQMKTAYGRDHPDCILERTILNAERSLHEEEQKEATPWATPEEQKLLDRLSERLQAGEPEALAEFVAALTDNSSPSMYLVAGNELARSGQNEKAIDFYLTALDSENELMSGPRLQAIRNLGIISARTGDFERSSVYL